MSLNRRWSAGFLALVCCAAAKGAVFCVESELALTDALATAETNGEDNDIRLRGGAYVAPQGGWAIDLHDALHSLAITGGYQDASCTARSAEAAATVLDGGGIARILTIDTSESFGSTNAVVISVTGITFTNGHGTHVGALKISDPGPIFGGIIRVEGNAFLDNVADGATQEVTEDAPAVLVATDGPDFAGGTGIFVSNNVFARNTGANAAAFYAYTNNHIDVTGNTFADNVSTDTSLDERLTFDGFANGGIAFTDNIFWNNNSADAAETFDLHFDARTASSHNDIEHPTGTPSSSTDDLNVDPAFVDDGGADYTLSEASTLRDRGDDQPDGGLAEFDLAGKPRIFGPHVDIGAYEFTPAGDGIFKGDFEVAPP